MDTKKNIYKMIMNNIKKDIKKLDEKKYVEKYSKILDMLNINKELIISYNSDSSSSSSDSDSDNELNNKNTEYINKCNVIINEDVDDKLKKLNKKESKNNNIVVDGIGYKSLTLSLFAKFKKQQYVYYKKQIGENAKYYEFMKLCGIKWNNFNDDDKYDVVMNNKEINWININN